MNVQTVNKPSKRRLSPQFFITVSMYVAFSIMGTLSPILELSQYLLPIFVLIMLHGKELYEFIGLEYAMLTFNILRRGEGVIAITKTAGNIYSLINNIIPPKTPPPDFLFSEGFYFYTAIFFAYLSILINYATALYIVRKKHIRERVGVAIA